MYWRGQITVLNLGHLELKGNIDTAAQLTYFPTIKRLGSSENSNKSGNLLRVLCIPGIFTYIISFKFHNNLVTQTLLLPF